MNKLIEVIQKIKEVTLDQSTANVIATQALKEHSEVRFYSEEELFNFSKWYREMDGWEYLEGKTMKEVFEIYIKTFIML